MHIQPISHIDYADTLNNSSQYLEGLRNKEIFFTGATGFFGKWLSQILMGANKDLQLNLKMTVITRNASRALLEQPWLDHPSVTIISGDIRSFPLIDKKFDFFIHGATAASASLNISQPEEMADTIIEGTKRVLLQASISKQPKFLFISSGAVYGAQDPLIPLAPEDLMTGPDISNVANAYAEAKRMAEVYCQFAHSQKKVNLVVARCYAFLGPYLPLDQHFAAGNFIKDLLDNKIISLTGDGSPFRSYMYPSDLVEWLLALLVKARPGTIYNVGSDEEVQLSDLARMINNERMNFSFNNISEGVNILGSSQLKTKRNAYVPSIIKARSELGLKIRVNLVNAIKKTISWHLDNKQRKQ